MAYVNPRSGFTTKPDIAGQLNSLTALLQNMSAKQQQQKQFQAQMAQRKAEEKVRQEQQKEQMTLQRDQFKETVKGNELMRDIYQLQIDAGTTEKEMREAEAEYFAIIGAGPQQPAAVAPSLRPTGAGYGAIDRQTPTVGADAAMLNDLTGLAAQGGQPPSTISRTTPQPGTVPTGGRWTEESYRAMIAQQPPEIRQAAVIANPGFFMPRSLPETVAWLDASRLWGFELPGDLKPMEGMVTEKRALDDRLLNMQITQEEYNTESLRLGNEWEQFRLDNKEKFLPQYGSGGGAQLPPETQGEALTNQQMKTGLDEYLIIPEVGEESSVASMLALRVDELNNIIAEYQKEGNEEMAIYANNILRRLGELIGQYVQSESPIREDVKSTSGGTGPALTKKYGGVI